MKNEFKDVTEIELIDMAKSTDTKVSNKAFKELYAKNKKIVYYFLIKNIGMAEDAEDMVQVVFEKAFRNIQKYEPDFKFSTWVMRIARNTLIDKVRQKSLKLVEIWKDDEDGVEMKIDFIDNARNPEEETEKNQRNEFVHKLLEDRLTGDYKLLIELFYFKQKSYDEIAEELELPLGTVKAKIFRAKELLRKDLPESVILTA